MKKSSTLLSLLSVAVFSSSLFAQNAIPTEKTASHLFPKSKEIQWREQTKTPGYIEFQANSGINHSTFFKTYSESIGLGIGDEFKLKSEESDLIGYKHYRYQQYYKGIKVEGGEYAITEKQGNVNALQGYFFKGISTKTTPTITAIQALNAAKLAVGAKSYKWEMNREEVNPLTTAELLIAAANGNYENPEFHLAYKLDIYAHEPVGRYYVYVDATTGKVINTLSRIHVANTTGTSNTKYNGARNISTDSYNGSYRMRTNVALSTGRKLETYNMNNGTNYTSAVDFTDADNNWTADPVANSAHFGAEACYDYYLTKHNRNSFDNAGAAIKSYVHYDNNYVNAYWDGTKMTYGDGDNTNYSALTSLDVVGHEITHAFTERTSNLAYQNESGALNESFSDIFGVALEFYVEGAAGDWLMGEDFDIKNHVGFRSMSNPNSQGQPDTYAGTNYQSNSIFPNLADDYGGVHTNSGVQNFWFYLLSAGGSGTNDKGSAYSVTGIGVDKAAAIAFRNNTFKLTSAAKHTDARTGAINSAKELYGVGSQEEISVTNAWYAVGVGAAYSGPPAGCSVAASLSSSNVTSSSATLSWGTVSGAQSYSIRYKATASSTWTTTTATATSVAVSGLTASTAYEFQVQTVCSGTSSSAYSASSNFTTGSATTTCDVASSLNASGVNSSSATLNWGAVSGAQSYAVRYKATASSTWLSTTATGTSVSVSGLSASTAYEFQVQTVCSGTLSSAYSGSANFSTTSASVTYCAAKGTSASSEWIKQVQIGSINNSTAANAGYGNFTSMSTNLTQGATISITLTPGFSNNALGQPNSYPEYWRVYVDFNQDGDFTDAGELAFDAGATSTIAKTGNLVTPSGASLGATRMRVMMKYNAAPTSCETFAEGEVEDYTATIVSSAPVTCNIPASLSATSITSTTATLNWGAVSGAQSYAIRYKATSSSTWSNTTATGTSVNASGLTASTTYEFQVQTVCSGTSSSAFSASSNFSTSATPVCNVASGLNATGVNATSATLNWGAVSGAQSYNVQYKATASSTWISTSATGTSVSVSGLSASTAYEFQIQTVCSGTSSSAYSSSANFTTTAASVTYCTAKGTSAASEWIKQVQIGSINNSTAANAGYGNFTSISTNLTKGTTISITLTPGFGTNVLGQPNSYPEYWRVYIDFNQDGDFTDAGELAFDAGATSTTAKTGNLVVPSSASLGTTRMRVMMKYNAAPTSCETFAEGEVEDYTANIVSSGSFAAQKAITTEEEVLSYNVFPNPTNGLVTITMNMAEVESSLNAKVFDLSGKLLLSKELGAITKGNNDFNVSIESLPAGVYSLVLQSNGFTKVQKLVLIK